MEEIAIESQYDIEARKTMVKAIAGIDDKLNKKRLENKQKHSLKTLVHRLDEAINKK